MGKLNPSLTHLISFSLPQEQYRAIHQSMRGTSVKDSLWVYYAIKTHDNIMWLTLVFVTCNILRLKPWL